MNVFEHAMQMEQDGREYYLKQAEASANQLLKKILLELAADELKHYELFKAMRDENSAQYNEAERTTVLSTLKNVFETMAAEEREFTFPDDARQVWVFARDLEKKTEDFYREQADLINDESQKELLHQIADEEHRHWLVMENVIQFLDKPKHWLDNAEWPEDQG